MVPPTSCCLRFFILLSFAILSSEAQQLVFDYAGDNYPNFLNCPPPTASRAPSPQPPSNNDTANSSKFRYNLARLLEALPSSAATAGGFAARSRGNGSDHAFVRGLCLGDISKGDCQVCLLAAAQEIYNNCSSSRRAAIWMNRCFLFFADTNTSTTYEEDYRRILYNVNSVSNKTAFQETYYELMRSLSARAADGTPELPSVAPMFATGQAVYDPRAPNGTLYGMLQCMRDLTSVECSRCLETSIRALPMCCSGHQGGLVVGYNCYLRMEVYTYYDLALDAPSLRPLGPTPSPSSSKEIRQVLLSTSGPCPIPK